jgi:hypothetical protein
MGLINTEQLIMLALKTAGRQHVTFIIVIKAVHGLIV